MKKTAAPSTTVLVNATVTANTNTVADKSAVVRAAVTNCVVWGNLGKGVRQTATLQPAFSCFPDADGANGTTARDPGLAEVDGKIFTATALSCRGKGLRYDWMDNAGIRSLDWYGAPRIYRGRPDMGWVSFRPVPPLVMSVK